MKIDDQAIRARAYRLWEAAGSPENEEERFWHEAERQLKEEQIQHELKTPDTCRPDLSGAA
ncbi:DUF2934 domain-containing protein [Bradyrhizobium sp. Leo121]|uniref:DUF2934 domain-containing protein n=1 Tax=Bradyrhizobium sp. Leo121 TaxID=1571195 RepID=UPI00102984B5|nr:DUF2934 domain-containing protein [Bradyrhizobium sp. Leo121]RZN24174.1 hypothetical protein CWO90_29210 [Bradyrhizobium sp. Leo121]